MRGYVVTICLLCAVSIASAATTAPASAPARLDLTGVVMSDKRPVSHAMVYVYTAGVRVGTSPYCPSCYADCGKHVSTDLRGQFKIEALDPQLIFRILVVAEGFEPAFVSQVDPAAGPMKAQLKRRKMAADVYHCVRGRVIDQDKRPVVGAEVSPFGMKKGDRRWWGATDGEVDPLSITNDRGEFVLITREADVHVDIDVRARGLAPGKFPLLPTGMKQHQLQLVRGGTITGRLIHQGEPLADVAIALVQADTRVEDFVGDVTIGTDKNGRFTLANVKPGMQCFIYAKMDSLAERGLAVAATAVQTPATDEIKDVGDLKVSPAHRVRGVVRLSNSASLPPNTRLLLSRNHAWDSRIVPIASDGSFEVVGVPDEEVTISVRVRGYHMSEKNACIDLMNWHLTGRVPKDIDGLEILLDPGEPNYQAFRDKPSDERAELHERFAQARKGPLRGVEKK